MNDPAEEAVSFVESVCFRPAMYTINGTLPEAAAFLQGFYSAMGGHGSTEAGREEAQFWWNFCRFACGELGWAEHGDWYQLAQALQARHHDEEAAFSHLAELCALYSQSHAEHQRPTKSR